MLLIRTRLQSQLPLSFSRVRSWIAVTSGVRLSLQVSHLVQRPDFDLARSRHGTGAALHPGDRLVHVFDLQGQIPRLAPVITAK
jgi:hypothetical protein